MGRLKSPETKPYPTAVKRVEGCKVAWLYFTSGADARKASDAALWNAGVKEGQGYDFGYQTPGMIDCIP